jgi:hypothetical protein
MSPFRLLLLLALAVTGGPVPAQTIVSSPAPDRVAVTVYRDPDRSAGEDPRPDWLNGYALISETRRISVPAGESTIRFEGVAGGLVPQTAIVTGFPDGIVERNRDAYLLSPATLLDRSLGRRVHLRRTSHATGAVREEEAVIRSGAGGAVVLQTAAGYETLRCTGLSETLLYEQVPPELTPTPTLSVRTRASQPVTATVTLSYLATGFDWQANYIVNLAPDERRADFFAWMTLASTDETSFPNADTQAVAGRINYDAPDPQPREGGPLSLDCWPWATTSDIPLEQFVRMADARPRARGGVWSDGSNVVVTGTRVPSPNLEAASPIAVVSAQQEDLGDLKLYRIPEPVTVAANSQKQVALLTRPRVRVAMVYRQRMYALMVVPSHAPPPESVPLVLVTRNSNADGLGLPLPAGSVLLFAQGPDRPILLGQGSVADRAVGEDVEIEFDEASGVTTQIELIRETPRWQEYRLTATNDQRRPVPFEAEFPLAGDDFRPERRLGRRDGRPFWSTTIPANGRVTLRYRILKVAEVSPA